MGRSGEEQELRRIQGLVERFLVRGLDRENLASEIWLELWVKSKVAGHPIRASALHVRYRCADEARRRKREAPLVGDIEVRIIQPKPDVKPLLDKIMRCPTLTADERRLIYRKFYAGEGNLVIARSLGRSKTAIKRIFRGIFSRLRDWVSEERLVKEGLEGIEREEEEEK